MQYANLHLHSTYSDAGFTPEQLVKIGKSLGYGALALTDHETDGGCKEFMRACERMGVKSIPGAEFYGTVDGTCIHLTALDFDQNDPGIRAFIKHRCDLHEEFARIGFERAVERGVLEGVTWDDVRYFTDEGSWYCIDTVFKALYLKKAMPEGGEAYVRANLYKTDEMKALKPKHPTAEEVIKVVRKAGGVVAWAHPRADMGGSIEKLVDWGLNGIEVNHPGMTFKAQLVAEEMAKRYHLYSCGGTDHTGPMGCNDGHHAVPVFSGITEQQYDTLVTRRLG